MNFGQRIKQARQVKGLSQQALANKINALDLKKKVSRTAIAQWESGASKEIESANLLYTAAILGVSPEWLRFGAGGIPSRSQYLNGLSLVSRSEAHC